MSQYSKRIEYSPDADILTIQVSQKKVDHAQEAGNFIIHVAEDGEPVLIEILDASDFLMEIWVEVFSKGLEPEEFASAISKGIMAALSPNVFPEILREILKRVRHHSLAR